MDRSDTDIVNDYGAALLRLHGNTTAVTRSSLAVAKIAASKNNYLLGTEMATALSHQAHGVKFYLGAFIDHMTAGWTHERKEQLAKFGMHYNERMINHAHRYYKVLDRWPFLFIVSNWTLVAESENLIDCVLSHDCPAAQLLRARFDSLTSLVKSMSPLLPASATGTTAELP